MAFGELALRQQVKQAGGTWNPERKVSELRYDRAVALGLVDRIVPGAGSERGPSIRWQMSRRDGPSIHPQMPASIQM